MEKWKRGNGREMKRGRGNKERSEEEIEDK